MCYFRCLSNTIQRSRTLWCPRSSLLDVFWIYSPLIDGFTPCGKPSSSYQTRIKKRLLPEEPSWLEVVKQLFFTMAMILRSSITVVFRGRPSPFISQRSPVCVCVWMYQTIDSASPNVPAASLLDFFNGLLLSEWGLLWTPVAWSRQRFPNASATPKK